jgi:uncharacterized SAM-binding protein YcdF (DUF218 family)
LRAVLKAYRGAGSQSACESGNGMLFFLRKLIEALLLPIGICGCLTITGIVLRRRWVVVAGFVTLYIFSTAIFSRLLMEPLEGFYAPHTVTSAPDADLIVVLSGGVVRGITAPGVQWGETSNRYFAGFDLAMAGKARRIVFSAGVPESGPAPGQGTIMRQVAIAHGIDPERIIVTPPVFTTEDEAREISKIPGIHSVLLVTSAFHMPRAVMLFRARGLDVNPFPTDELVLGRMAPTLFILIPGAVHLQRSEAALREYYGLVVYRIGLFLRPPARIPG